MQYKQQFKIQMKEFNFPKGRVCVNDKKIGWMVKLPNDLPMSSILTENKDDYVTQIQQLYNKYISVNAPLQVNISYECRQAFDVQLSNINRLKNNDLMGIFDDILGDLFRILTSSFQRFMMDIDKYEENQKQDIISVMMETTNIRQ